jgi:hypothetical protein
MKKLLLIAFSTIIHFASAQDLTLFSMSPDVYSRSVHPEAIPEKKYVLQIPFLSSFGFQYSNNAFTYRDVIKKRSDDSLTFDIDKALSKKKDLNFIGLDASITLLGFGVRSGDNFFNFSINERLVFGFAYPKDLINLIDKGNGPYIGQTLEFTNASFDFTHFREYVFGFSRKMTDRLTAGVNLKVMYGMENFSTANKNIRFTTQADDYSLQLNSDVAINSSSYVNSENGYDDMKAGKYWFGGLHNKGLALDLGAEYKLNEKWKFNASILDFGYIRWKSNVRNYRTEQGVYTFSGVDLSSFVDDTVRNVQHILDSLSESYRTKETFDSYTTYLHSRILLSAGCQLQEKTMLTGILDLRFFNGYVRPSITAAVNQKVSSAFDVALSYSYLNRSLNNLGLGFRLHTGSVQVFGATDNIFGFFAPLNFKTAGFRAGLIFNWGDVADKTE